MKPKTLFFSILSIVLLVLTAIELYRGTHPRECRYGPVISAERLSAKPAEYVVVTDPDPYLLEALSNAGTEPNLGREVFIGSWDNTNIDELLESHGYKTFNVEYNYTYYTVHLGSVTPASFLWILLFSWIVLGVGFVINHLRTQRA